MTQQSDAEPVSILQNTEGGFKEVVTHDTAAIYDNNPQLRLVEEIFDFDRKLIGFRVYDALPHSDVSAEIAELQRENKTLRAITRGAQKADALRACAADRSTEMTIHFDIERAKNELRRLFHENPELEEDCVLAADMVEGSTSFPELVDKLLKVIQEAKVMEEAVRLQIAQLKVRQDRFANRQQRIRELLLYMMQLANQKKIERPGGTVTVANGPSKVIITDEQMIDATFFRYKKEINKNLIGAVLKDGNPVPGATLSNAEPMLVIRT